MFFTPSSSELRQTPRTQSGSTDFAMRLQTLRFIVQSWKGRPMRSVCYQMVTLVFGLAQIGSMVKMARSTPMIRRRLPNSIGLVRYISQSPDFQTGSDAVLEGTKLRWIGA